MLDFKVKTTHQYKAEQDNTRVSIVVREDSCYLEIYWGQGYSNSMYFVVASLEEAKALAAKCAQFLADNGSVLDDKQREV